MHICHYTFVHISLGHSLPLLLLPFIGPLLVSQNPSFASTWIPLSPCRKISSSSLMVTFLFSHTHIKHNQEARFLWRLYWLIICVYPLLTKNPHKALEKWVRVKSTTVLAEGPNLAPHQVAHTSLYVQHQGIQHLLLASEGACTHRTHAQAQTQTHMCTHTLYIHTYIFYMCMYTYVCVYIMFLGKHICLYIIYNFKLIYKCNISIQLIYFVI